MKIKNNKFLKIFLSLGVFLVWNILLINSVFAERNYLFTWDEGEGTNMPGWTWSDDVAYGHPGWTLNADGPLGGGGTSSWGYGPRCFEKNDNYTDSAHPFSCMANVITTDKASSSADSGGSFKVFDDGGSDYYRAGWWIWYDYKPLQDRAITNDDTNRWSFYVKATGIQDLTTASQFSFPNSTMTIGTYLCWKTGDPVYGQGDGCPYEGPGNQHYYHYITLSADAWVHVELDRHPQWLRNTAIPDNDPVFPTYGKHYFNQLFQFYIEISGSLPNPTSYTLDEMNFYSTKDTAEPDQNDISISSVWVGYFPSTRKWQIGWQKGITYSSGWSTYEVRWSTSPITNENFSEATPIVPEYYGGVSATGAGGEHLVREPDSYRQPVWTQFDIPDEIEENHSVIYFAIKDVSKQGEHLGNNWPYNKGDFHDTPSPYIHTIDYYLRPDSVTRSDVDQNSTTNSTDAMLTLRNSLGLNMSSTNWQSSTTTGDVNCDGVSNSTDAMLILRHSLGLNMSGTGWCED